MRHLSQNFPLSPYANTPHSLVEDGLTQFQNSNLPDRDEEWHKLVPPEAQEALGDREVQRQSTLFEVVKSERDYVHDMELIQGVRFSSLPLFLIIIMLIRVHGIGVHPTLTRSQPPSHQTR